MFRAQNSKLTSKHQTSHIAYIFFQRVISSSWVIMVLGNKEVSISEAVLTWNTAEPEIPYILLHSFMGCGSVPSKSGWDNGILIQSNKKLTIWFQVSIQLSRKIVIFPNTCCSCRSAHQRLLSWEVYPNEHCLQVQFAHAATIQGQYFTSCPEQPSTDLAKWEASFTPLQLAASGYN